MSVAQVNSSNVGQVNFGDLQNRINNQQVREYSKYDPAPSNPSVRNQIYGGNVGQINSPSKVHQPKNYQYRQPTPVPYSNNPQQGALQRAGQTFWSNQPNPIPSGSNVSVGSAKPASVGGAGLGGVAGVSVAAGIAANVGGQLAGWLGREAGLRMGNALRPIVIGRPPLTEEQLNLLRNNLSNTVPGSNIPPGLLPDNSKPNFSDGFSFDFPPAEQPYPFTLQVGVTLIDEVPGIGIVNRRPDIDAGYGSAIGIPIRIHSKEETFTQGDATGTLTTFYLDWIDANLVRRTDVRLGDVERQ